MQESRCFLRKSLKRGGLGSNLLCRLEFLLVRLHKEVDRAYCLNKQEKKLNNYENMEIADKK